jgi:hypothetical protein
MSVLITGFSTPACIDHPATARTEPHTTIETIVKLYVKLHVVPV